jgi:hypothetical protein
MPAPAREAVAWNPALRLADGRAAGVDRDRQSSLGRGRSRVGAESVLTDGIRRVERSMSRSQEHELEEPVAVDDRLEHVRVAYEAFASRDCSFIEARFAPRGLRRRTQEPVEHRLSGSPRCRRRRSWSIDLRLLC